MRKFGWLLLSGLRKIKVWRYVSSSVPHYKFPVWLWEISDINFLRKENSRWATACPVCVHLVVSCQVVLEELQIEESVTSTQTTDDDARSRRHKHCGFLHILCSITNWCLIYYTLHLCHADVTFSYSPQNSPLNLHQKMVKPQTNCNRKFVVTKMMANIYTLNHILKI